MLDGAYAFSHDLQLEVFINGVSTELIASVRLESGGILSMDPEQLRNVGIQPVKAAKRPDGRIDLSQLPNVSVVYDGASQTLSFSASNAERSPRIVSASRGNDPLTGDNPQNHVETGFGGLINYSINTSGYYGFDTSRYGHGGISGAFESRVFSPAGVLSNTAALSLGEVRRLESFWTYSNPNTMRTYRAGDLITSGLSWTRPTRLGGVQIQRNFGLRPGLVTVPIPGFAGTAAVPSTVDVFLGNTRRFSGPVPAGPFEIADMPTATGPGTALIVVRDETGAEVVTEAEYFISDKLLRTGLLDYSLELGFPRTGYGSQFDMYDERLMGSASIRYGALDWLTLEGHAEGGEGLINAGMGVVAGLGKWGVGSLSMSGSTTGEETGIFLSGAIELEIASVHVEARMQRSFGAFNDIASYTFRTADDDGHPNWSGAVPRALDQISFSFPLTFLEKTNLNLNFTRIERFDGDQQSVASASFSTPLFDGTFSGSAYADMERNEYGVLAAFSRPLGGDMTLNSSSNSIAEGLSSIASVGRPASEENGNFGWDFAYQQNDKPIVTATVEKRIPIAKLSATVRQRGESLSASGRLSGSVVAAGGGVFLTNRIDDAFAVVDAGASGVPVLLENQEVGVTGPRGKLLIPDLRSYERNRIGIDPMDLPLDVVVDSTGRKVVPAGLSGVVVEFTGSQEGGSALITFRDENGDFLEVGTTGKTEGSSEPFAVGYDGQAFIENLGARNRVTMTRTSGAKCIAEFEYARQAGAQVMLPDVTCIAIQ
ncbi:fimbria/pilus outer membrane usher protein [Hoeflea sp. WL0058]|uniref:Fimbria/pilus outer membrane usher protein n=2 Tax=Flavimaribacter sediminis TaxID=2865987 RepID=A0AAE2ZNC3_9HYPH|nr:fimbria/pilus outer membrane usher protein [Flavimaribacter sediminis]